MKKTKENVFLEMINGLTIDTETFKESRPNSTFFIKDKKCFLELKKSDLWCDYKNVWSVFESQFDMDYGQIRDFIKDMTEEHLNINGVTPSINNTWSNRRLEEHPVKYLDRAEKEAVKGDIINLHQTVNGQNLFVLLSINPLDIRYAHDLLREYEYDKAEMLAPCRFTGETKYEIVANIYNVMQMKQTAVEWMEQNIPDISKYIPLGIALEFAGKFQHAKEMEKEQLKDAYGDMGKNMNGLLELGWENRCDTFDTYYKKINDYEVCVSQHTTEKHWTVTLVHWHDNETNEIAINYDATFEWVVAISEMLSYGAN